MAINKFKIEGGQGGKRGHSNMEHWVTSEELKDAARKNRRIEAKRVVREEVGNLSDALKASDFRRIALGMKGAVESAHMGHPDFRANGRIFATLHADDKTGMVKLTPDQQQAFLRDAPTAFAPENGAWGRQGCTAVRLDAVDEDTLGEALTLAWQNVSARRAAPRARRAKPARR